MIGVFFITKVEELKLRNLNSMEDQIPPAYSTGEDRTAPAKDKDQSTSALKEE